MTNWDYIGFAYAGFLMFGGVMGYVKKGSVPSLAAGVGCGALAAYGAYLTSKNPDNYVLAAAVAVGVGALMGFRFANSRKLMPAGLTCLASLGMMARYGQRALAAR